MKPRKSAEMALAPLRTSTGVKNKQKVGISKKGSALSKK